jgi:hypothetical protein
MAEVTRIWAHEADWSPRQHRSISCVLSLISNIEDMARELEKTYDTAFDSNRVKPAA